MGERKVKPRRQVLAIITDMRQVTNAIRKAWDYPVWGQLPDGSYGKRAEKDLPGGVVADWVQIREAADCLRQLADQLDETAAHAIMTLRRDQS